MQDAGDNVARQPLARAIPRVRHASRLVECPSREQIAEARRSGILWVRFQLSIALISPIKFIAALADRDGDLEMWLRAVQLAWPRSSSLWLKIMRGRRFRVGLEVPVAQGGWFSTCESLVTPGGIQDRGGAAHRAVIPIRLVVDDNRDNAYLLWRDIRQLVTLQTETSSCRITEVHVDRIREQWSRAYMTAAQQLAGDGVLVRPMTLQSPMSLDDSAFYFPTARHSIIGDDEGNTYAEYQPCDVVAVDLDADDDTLDSVFTALMTSPNVRGITIEKERRTPGSSHDRLWQWLAISFFKGNASNAIQSLKLKSCDLRMCEVVELERMLREENPLAALYPSLHQFQSRWESNQLASAYEFRLAAPRTGETFQTRSMSSIILASPVKSMVILDASDEWLTVLLPGWGRAWVQRDNAVLSPKEGVTPTHSRTLRTSRHLTLTDFVDEQGHVVRAFFNVVGSSIHKLTLENCRVSDATLRIILRECGNVEELAIFGADDSTLQVITECYEQGHCRAAQIEISLPQRSNRGQDGASQLIRQLGNTKHELAKHVRVLHFAFVPGGWVDELQETILAMLKHNRTLDELYINSRLEPEHPNRRPAQVLNEEAIAAQAVYPDDGLQPLHVEGSPGFELNTLDNSQMLLDTGVVRKRSAFLSVTRGHQDIARTEYHAITQLNSNVLSVIFAFAAETHPRCVHVQI